MRVLSSEMFRENAISNKVFYLTDTLGVEIEDAFLLSA